MQERYDRFKKLKTVEKCPVTECEEETGAERCAGKKGEFLWAMMKGFGLYFKRSVKKRSLHPKAHEFTQIPEII